ncbi:MAG: bifunctional oligoribonuclease/PAP phosphatase NrnA [Candidatus Omnitrophica bacterium]|nr:bifunctional oligoribonuclease/PAP phosphatase NrnA [Candidatus Omnitrophota bacterium]
MDMKKTAQAIKKYDNYIVTSHINTEGDAIGSELAVYHLVKQLGKHAVVINNDLVPERYLFLPDADKIARWNDWEFKDYNNSIIVDCPTVERCGNIAPAVQRSRIKINIDHHVSNVNFGDFNWVEPDASSCGEMIFNLYKELGLNINEEIATMLYVAILTDTGSFRYDSTTLETHQVAGELIKIGVKPDKVAEKVYEAKGLNDIELLSKALSTIRVEHNNKIAYIYVTKKMLEETGTLPDRTDGFVDFARSIKGAEISMFFREDMDNPKRVHVGFRSKGRVNVNMLASRFGGGGHPKASGCVLEGSLKYVIDVVLKEAKEFLV